MDERKRERLTLHQSKKTLGSKKRNYIASRISKSGLTENLSVKTNSFDLNENYSI